MIPRSQVSEVDENPGVPTLRPFRGVQVADLVGFVLGFPTIHRDRSVGEGRDAVVLVACDCQTTPGGFRSRGVP